MVGSLLGQKLAMMLVKQKFKNMDLLLLGKIITGNMPLDDEDVTIISTNKAQISLNVPADFQIDGEYCGKETKLNIEILKGQMKVAIPYIDLSII